MCPSKHICIEESVSMNDIRLDLGEYIFISSLCKPVADPGIDRRGRGGADFFLQ